MITACALQATAYMHRTGTLARHLAKVSVKNHGNALKNPLSQLPMALTIDDVLNSAMIADPLHMLDCSPVSDGCCAVVIAAKERAKRLPATPVWIKGVSFCADAYYLGDRDLSRANALTQAAQKAFQMADIHDPSRQIDVAEVYDAFTYQELMWLEAMGLCADSQAGTLLEKGVFDMGGALPVNPSGGLLSGHPVIAAGLIRLAEVVLQLREDAGDHQVRNARRGLAHGVNGLCGQSHCVWILDRQI
jgi:acetyl-CoA C-acetyltransferase